MTDPIARVTVEPADFDPAQRLLIVQKCPYCGRKHTHGGGTTGDVRQYLGPRVSHCHRGEYVLALDEPIHTDRIRAALPAGYAELFGKPKENNT